MTGSHSPPRARAALTTAALAAFLATSLAATSGHATAPDVTVPQPPEGAALVLDGKGDDPAWATAVPLEGFTVYEPRPGLPERFEARARVLYRPDALWVLVEADLAASDLNPIRATRDTYPPDDRVELQLDTWGDGRRAFAFVVGSSGVLYDATLNDIEEYDASWDSLFDAAVHITDTGWTTEIMVPFQSLRFDPEGEGFRAHLYVESWRHQQTLSWAPMDLDINNRLVQMGRWRGFPGAQPGRTVELLPALTVSWRQQGDDKPPCRHGYDVGSFTACDAVLDYGLGVKWAITPALTMDAVFNPDFSQVEADARLLTVNNRFALFLDERRPFFVEGVDVFTMPIDVVYTRSIVRPEAALKLTGRVGDVRLGVLTAYDTAPPDTVSSDPGFRVSERAPDATAVTTIARLQVDKEGTSAGAVFIDRTWVDGDGRAIGTNQVLGADAASQLTPKLSLEGAAFVSHAKALIPQGEDAEPDEDRTRVGHAARLRTVWREEAFRVQAHYERVSQDFRAETGFIPRAGYNELFLKLDGYFRSEEDWGRFVSPGVWARGWLDDRGDVQERIFGFNTYWLFGARTSLFVEYERLGEQLRWTSTEGEAATGWIDGNTAIVSVTTRALAWLDVNPAVDFGDTPIRDPSLRGDRAPYKGSYVSPRLSVTVRPIEALTWRLTYAHRLLYADAAEGGRELASQPLTRQTLSWFITRAWSIRYQTDWDAFEDLLVNDLLVSWEPSPGTVFFLGYREQTELAPLATRERGLFLKFSILFTQ